MSSLPQTDVDIKRLVCRGCKHVAVSSKFAPVRVVIQKVLSGDIIR